ncbi:MAG: hypothetical protein ACK58T_09010, partial [Phycisphaerae bacterium]
MNFRERAKLPPAGSQVLMISSNEITRRSVLQTALGSAALASLMQNDGAAAVRDSHFPATAKRV